MLIFWELKMCFWFFSGEFVKNYQFVITKIFTVITNYWRAKGERLLSLFLTRSERSEHSLFR